MRAGLIIALLMLSSCYAEDIRLGLYDSKSPLPAEIARIVLDADRTCSVIYHSRDIWVVEQHCAGGNKQGIYLSDASGVTRYKWFDEQFNAWAANEGCNTRQDCFYEVVIDGKGKITGFTYRFYINLSEGCYRVSVQNGKLVVIEKSVVDHPS